MIAYWCRIHPFAAGTVGHERPIDREQDSLHAHLGNRAGQCRIGKCAASREPKMLAVVVGECPRHRGTLVEDVVGPPQQKWRGLAEMANDDLERRKLVK